MNRTEIKPTCLRDASYVFGNLGPGDAEEVACQLPDGFEPWQVAYSHVRSLRSHIAYLDGVPVMAFGVNALTPLVASVWAVGTADVRRVVPEVTRFWRDDLVPWGVERGFQYAEARSLATNRRAHRWLMNTFKAKLITGPQPYGKAGEPFILFRFAVSDYRSTVAQ